GPVAVLFYERIAEGKTQRAHGREEGGCDAGRNPEFAYVESVNVLVKIARVQEQGKLGIARRRIAIFREEVGQQQLRLHEGSKPSADRIAGAAMRQLAVLVVDVDVPRAEVAFAEATDGIKAAGKERSEERSVGKEATSRRSQSEQFTRRGTEEERHTR